MDKISFEKIIKDLEVRINMCEKRFNKLKTKDKEVKDCIESIDADIDLIGNGEIGEKLLKNLEITSLS